MHFSILLSVLLLCVATSYAQSEITVSTQDLVILSDRKMNVNFVANPDSSSITKISALNNGSPVPLRLENGQIIIGDASFSPLSPISDSTFQEISSSEFSPNSPNSPNSNSSPSSPNSSSSSDSNGNNKSGSTMLQVNSLFMLSALLLAPFCGSKAKFGFLLILVIALANFSTAQSNETYEITVFVPSSFEYDSIVLTNASSIISSVEMEVGSFSITCGDDVSSFDLSRWEVNNEMDICGDRVEFSGIVSNNARRVSIRANEISFSLNLFFQGTVDIRSPDYEAFNIFSCAIETEDSDRFIASCGTSDARIELDGSEVIFRQFDSASVASPSRSATPLANASSDSTPNASPSRISTVVASASTASSSAASASSALSNTFVVSTSAASSSVASASSAPSNTFVASASAASSSAASASSAPSNTFVVSTSTASSSAPSASSAPSNTFVASVSAASSSAPSASAAASVTSGASTTSTASVTSVASESESATPTNTFTESPSATISITPTISPAIDPNGRLFCESGTESFNLGGASGEFGCDGYTDDSTVSWTITSPASTIFVAFTRFRLEQCCTTFQTDILTVYDGPDASSPLIGVFEEDDTPDEIQSSSNSLHFVFTSNGADPEQGFIAVWDEVPNVIVPLPVCDTVAKSHSTSIMQSVMPHKLQQFEECKATGPCSEPKQSVSLVPCVNGFAGIYPCDGIDLSAFVSLNDLGCIGDGSDIWGWTDTVSGKEYALFTCENGVSFVDVSDPTLPVVVAFLATESVSSFWRDVKVYNDHAFIVSEANNHGMQIIDLTQLRPLTGSTIVSLTHTALYTFGGGKTHNIVINEDSGFAYLVGTSTCNGGLHVVDISDPSDPQCSGCYDADGYTHDAQCVNYDGPDSNFIGREICFAYNEDSLTIVDVTDKANMVMISKVGYSGSAYTHQGWLTEDKRFVIANDELDETSGTAGGAGGDQTRTLIFNVEDLANPLYVNDFVSTTTVIDHNLYVKGNLVYESNYCGGLRVLEFDPLGPALSEIAFFDVSPTCSDATFLGLWSTYPYFDSGTLIGSTIDSGLFVLKIAD